MKIVSEEEKLIRNLPNGLLNWYCFEENKDILYIGKEEDSYVDILKLVAKKLIIKDINEINADWALENKESFDYIICVAFLEQILNPLEVIKLFRKVITSNGHLLLGMNNRLGIRYFCGDRDPYTERNFDGIEGYVRAYTTKEDVFQGRCYSKSEICKYLEQADWKNYQVFSVFSDLENPSLIFSEEYTPNEDLANRIFPTYYTPNTVFLEEENLYQTLIEENIFHKMANAYFLECSISGELSDVLQVTSSMERGEENALLTIIHKCKIVEKKNAFSEGRYKLKKLYKNLQQLKERGISVVDANLKDDVLIMPFIDAKVGQIYLKELLRVNVDKFLMEMDHFRDLILRSSEIVEQDKGDGNGAILKYGYFDMVPLNSFYINGEFVFYDQEFCEETYPANVLIWRMVASFYAYNLEAHKLLPIEVLLERYDLKRNIEKWKLIEYKFFDKLKNISILSSYYQNYRPNGHVIHSNRQRMNYSSDEYQRLFIDIFRNADTRKLILFGSGNFTKKFLEIYKEDYPVYAIIDNNKEKWGQEMEGITIMSPELLNKLSLAEYKVLICIKNYLSVMKQLDKMGVKEYSIFDAGKDYPRKRKPILQIENKDIKDKVFKKYHTGYVAGVYDLFHIGHLNLLKRAKEQCEYLIVGVISDEAVLKSKGKKPFIPCEERAEMIRSCRYVDEVVVLPENYRSIRDAYKQFHFDVQFSGNDHEKDEGWMREKKYLESQGAELVFFPYTEKTSSTKIKALIEKKLI